MTDTAVTRAAGVRRARRTLAAVSLPLAALAVLVDPLARQKLSDGRSIDLGLLQLKLAYNTGVAFSMGDRLPLAVVLAGTAAITIGIAAYAWRMAATASRSALLALSAVVAGAIANVFDRMIDGKVTDYFHTGWWPVFNLADVYITCGAALLVLALVREPLPDAPATT